MDTWNEVGVIFLEVEKKSLNLFLHLPYKLVVGEMGSGQTPDCAFFLCPSSLLLLA